MSNESNDQNFPRVTGTCHCGSIQITFPKPTTPVNSCQCSVCSQIAGLWTYFDQTQVKITVRPGTKRSLDQTFVYEDDGPVHVHSHPAAADADQTKRQSRSLAEETRSEGNKSTVQGTETAVTAGDAGKGHKFGLGPGVATYYWGDKMLYLCRCANCGIHTHWVPSEGYESTNMGINCRLLDRVMLDTLKVKITENWD